VGTDARGRLVKAAMELFQERGYGRTTVEEIAARSGLTERTFFRYFSDKREVLFSGSKDLEKTLVDMIAKRARKSRTVRCRCGSL
jgi:AcrR family transcriptional regulator